MIKIKSPAGETGFTLFGFQRILQVHRLLAKSVTGDNKSTPHSVIIHTRGTSLE